MIDTIFEHIHCCMCSFSIFMDIKQIIFLISILCLFEFRMDAQNQYSPFIGSVNLGAGVCSVVDFNKDNNGLSETYQIGIGVSRYINNRSLLSFGFNVTKRGTRYVTKTYTPTTVTTSTDRLSLHFLDVALTFHREINLPIKYESNVFLGINNSILIREPIYSLYNLNTNYYRGYNASIYVGTEFHKNPNLAYSLRINQSLLSIIEREYYDAISNLDSSHSPRIFPIEILFSVIYIIR